MPVVKFSHKFIPNDPCKCCYPDEYLKLHPTEVILNKYKKNELLSIITDIQVKGHAISGYSKANKDELIDFLTANFEIKENNKIYCLSNDEYILDIPEPEGRQKYGEAKKAKHEYWRCSRNGKWD